MTIQELDIEIEKCDKARIEAKEKGAELQKIRADLIEASEFDDKLAGMKPVKRQKFLKKLGKTDDEIKEIESKLPVRNVQHVTANVAVLDVKAISN
jgi:hypothetical protein